MCDVTGAWLTAVKGRSGCAARGREVADRLSKNTGKYWIGLAGEYSGLERPTVLLEVHRVLRCDHSVEALYSALVPHLIAYYPAYKFKLTPYFRAYYPLLLYAYI
jgi:hypothetical protein